ncbi:hypothetical protein [Burkholderia pseudomultivorans]|uniref:phage tail fiber protein n=1 Tax=Burkholderia pseudomultivorans TaxID=1207504 RepID=UPI000AD8B136|nr:hypothetical protein [Burkholderia pseudomultivorans]
MAALQKANLGTPPTGSDGDNQRTANTKFNSNVDVLNNQAALTTATPITTAQTLTANHVGKRISINLTAEGTINLPVASTCPTDAVLHLRNVGKKVTIAAASGSGNSFTTVDLNLGESLLVDTDGANVWRVLLRGRSYAIDEIVKGSLTVGTTASIGTDASIGRDLNVGGKVVSTGEIQSKATNGFRMVSGGDFGTFWRKDGSALYLMRTAAGDQYGNWDTPRPFIYSLKDDTVTIDGTGAGCKIGSRPTFAGKLAWDAGNLPNPWHAGNMTRPTVFSAAGGSETDINPNAYENRLSVNVVCGAGGAIMATATVALNLDSGVTPAVDAIAHIRIVDGSTVVFDGPDDAATVSGQDAGLVASKKIVAMVAKDGLTAGKTYTLQLLIKKTQPVGPLYPRFMRMTGFTS